MPAMFLFSRKKISRPRLVLALAWSCWPALLFYLLVLQLPIVSRTRLGIAVLLVPFLTFIAYQSISRLRPLSLNYWLILIAGSSLLSFLGSMALSFYPQKTYILSPQHTLKIQLVAFTNGQTVQLNRFQTSLGDISYDSFQMHTGWERKENTLIHTSNSLASLEWRGWTGDLTRLYLSGSPGVVIKVEWDNQSSIINLDQSGHAVVQQAFPMPLWEKLLLAWILCCTILYVAAVICVNIETEVSEGYFPAWVGYSFLTGFIFALVILVTKIRLENLELLLLLASALLFVMPIYLVLRHLYYGFLHRFKKYWSNIKLQEYAIPLIIFVSIVLAFGVFGRSLWTSWSIIDDHEIISFLGADGRMSLGEVFSTLPHTEVGLFGVYARFRPSYFLLRLIECFMWGAYPIYWHAFRIVILSIGISLFWTLMYPSLGWLGSGLLCAYALTFPYWGDVIGRLGPSETYAVAGLPIYIWGMVNSLRKDKTSEKTKYLAGLAILLGGVICIGTKENFLLLIFPSLYLAYESFKEKEFVAFISALGTILFASYVGTGIFLAVTRSGTDIYSNPVSPIVRVEKILSALQGIQSITQFFILVGLMAAVSLILLNGNLSGGKRKSIQWTQFWLAVFCIIYLSQLFFYDGFWPIGTRYDFPGMLYIPATIYVFFWLGQKLLSQTDNNSMLVLKTSTLLALILVVLMKGYGPITQILDENIRTTNAFTHGLEKMALLLRQHEDYALVIESGSASDYEPVFSYETFLRAYGVNNKLFLRIHGYTLDTARTGQEANLTLSLFELSKNGNGDFLPLDQLQAFGNKCFSLNLSNPITTECRPIQ